MMGRVRLNDHGVALPLALAVILILAVIVLAISSMTTSEVEIHRLTRWDALTQYLAQAGADHQIYLLKADKNAAAIAYTNYPVLPGETAGSGKLWYRTTLTCTLNCTGNPATRGWTIQSFGEIRQNDGSWTTLQQRTVRAQLQITYGGVGINEPTAVTLLRWEEVYP
jgi:hypothetical protein